MQTYRVAILGCRGRGTAAARAYHDNPRTDLVGLCDLLPERYDALGDELGVAARFADLDEMIRTVEPDIVAIPTGTEFHHELCLRVLEHSVHIEVEKPICTTLEQADEVLAKAKEKGVRVAVHHQGRSGAATTAVAEALKQGRIGQLLHLRGSGKGYYGGYGLLNIGTHTLNNMLRCAGPCRAVSATMLTDGRPLTPEDALVSPSGMGYLAGESITATLEFENGVSGTLLQHRFPKVDSTAYGYEVLGTEGRLFWRSGAAYLLPTPHYTPADEHSNWEALPLPVPEHYPANAASGLDDYRFADEYVQALDEGRDHESSGAEGRHVLEIMMGVFQAGVTGQRVALPQAERDHPLLRWRAENGLGPPPPAPRPYNEWLAEEDRRLGRT